MLINDLSYCEVVEENVVGGFGFSKSVNLDTDVDIDFDTDIDLNVDKDVNIEADSKVNVKGNFGSVEFDVTAAGNNGFGEASVSLFVGETLVEGAGSLVAGVS
jgi:hypothetical protein